MYIIVKKDGSKPTGSGGRMAFTPHMNRSMGKEPIFISSEKQYDYELKKRGLVRYDPDMPDAPKRKQYERKPETSSVLRAIKNQSDGKGHFTPSGRLKRELIERKVIRKQSDVEKIMSRTRNESGMSNE